MIKKSLGIISVLTLLWMIYGMFTTLVLRKTSKRLVKKLNTDGIALTFDDGPNEIYTIQLLDLLKRYDAKATFFVVGEKVDRHPEIVKRIHQEGHAIGIHHYQHLSSWKLTPKQLEEQLVQTDKAIFRATGEHPTLYRPPWGFCNLFTLQKAKNLDIIIWSHIFGDWKIHNCKRKLLEGLRQVPADGSIVLLHDDGANPGADDEAPAFMLQQLEKYLEESSQQNISFVKIEGRMLP
ncbi:polysaccharide deacetylase family protein [Aciduricibacillus chroicocephali]|uniref:Polysaccharide deacetylase family protein n=1 Tax=Aciduricibacillus chroicocephali TaxID=3054939 RepID=A0ABY9KXL6_9BACI|nr:polysaccharide deacetylase family protein [Bacillaceae bacterium 44XB]